MVRPGVPDQFNTSFPLLCCTVPPPSRKPRATVWIQAESGAECLTMCGSGSKQFFCLVEASKERGARARMHARAHTNLHTLEHVKGVPASQDLVLCGKCQFKHIPFSVDVMAQIPRTPPHNPPPHTTLAPPDHTLPTPTVRYGS